MLAHNAANNNMCPATPISLQGRFGRVDLAAAYILRAVRFGLRADVLWAQALYETGRFRHGGEVQPEWNNFCGLRLPDGSGYYRYASGIEGVKAHVAHLAVHALPDCPEKYRDTCRSDPKHPIAHWHDMNIVEDLETAKRAWCPSLGYAVSIMLVWNEGL